MDSREKEELRKTFNYRIMKDIIFRLKAAGCPSDIACKSTASININVPDDIDEDMAGNLVVLFCDYIIAYRSLLVEDYGEELGNEMFFLSSKQFNLVLKNK